MIKVGDRVKLNDLGRKAYICAADGCNPLNFAGTVAGIHHTFNIVNVNWDNHFSNGYNMRELTAIPPVS